MDACLLLLVIFITFPFVSRCDVLGVQFMVTRGASGLLSLNLGVNRLTALSAKALTLMPSLTSLDLDGKLASVPFIVCSSLAGGGDEGGGVQTRYSPLLVS